MRPGRGNDKPLGGGFLPRLARDRRGGTIAVMAMSMIPISALAGSGVDMARLYVVKVRLQQACDAGALAGRKSMIDSDSETLDSAASTQATNFFNSNFRSGWMSTSAVAFTPVKTADKQVAATASAVVPMTVMKLFSSPDVTLNVTCEARYDVPDVDIMFVLDTTGSMACTPSMSDDKCADFSADQPKVEYTRPSDTGGVPGYAGSKTFYVTESVAGGVNNSRMEALRVAVKNFYSTMASKVDPSTNVRYGFVTYSSMVNPGAAIIKESPSYMLGGGAPGGATSWTYQSREVAGDIILVDRSKNPVENGAVEKDCKDVRSLPDKTYDPRTSTATITRQRWSGSPAKCRTWTDTVGPEWQYKPVAHDVARFVAGDSVTTPTRVDGATSKWLGCIEERRTNPGQSSFDYSAVWPTSSNGLPPDLDPNLAPTADDARWRPLWPEAVYLRPEHNKFPKQPGDYINDQNYKSYANVDRLKLGKMACGKPVRRLGTMTATDIHNFVYAPDFKALGGTYHDIGMIWGARLISPNGLFAADTAPWTGRSAPKRVIIFMTDGAMAPSADGYSVYGVEKLDRRVTNDDADDDEREEFHNARFQAVCSKVRSMNVDIWTIAIAGSANAELTKCATSSDQALFTSSGTGLSEKFALIAERVAMLRISK